MRVRHVVLCLALLAAAVPSNGKGWFGLGDSGSRTVASPVKTGAHSPPAGVIAIPPDPAGSEAVAPPNPSVPSTFVPEPPTLVPKPAPAPVSSPAAVEPVAPAGVAPSPPKPPPAVVARLRPSGTGAYASPGDPVAATQLRGTTEFGTPRVLLTTATGNTVGEWVEVLLPDRPNGAKGWIRSSAAEFSTVGDRLVVDRAARTLTWERDGAVIGVVPAAIGSPSTPTPPGTYFVTDVLPYNAVGATSPKGQYGAWVVALNGHSEAFTTFNGGDARLAIHGTNQVASLGSASSSGCVRIGDVPLETLASNVALGTPVVVL